MKGFGLGVKKAKVVRASSGRVGEEYARKTGLPAKNQRLKSRRCM